MTTSKDIRELYDRVYNLLDEINELKKENVKLRIKFEQQDEAITAQNKLFARGIAYNFSKNIEVNNELIIMKKKEEEEVLNIKTFIDEIKEWKEEWEKEWNNWLGWTDDNWLGWTDYNQIWQVRRL